MASPAFPEFVPPLDPCNLPIRRCPVPREKASRRVLIQRNGAHGDILMATPFLTALRDAWPDVHITWIVERKEAQSIDAHPLVDELLLWDTSYWKRMVRRALLLPWVVRCLAMRRELRARGFDIFVSFQPEEWQLLARGCSAETRLGVFDTYREFYGDTQTSSNRRFYTDACVYEDHPTHRTDQYLMPLKALGLPEPADKRMAMGFTAEDDAQARAFLKEHDIAPGKFVAIAPMTTWPSRCWPADRFVALARRLQEDGYPIVLVGSAKEKPAIDEIAAQIPTPPTVAAGTFSFRAFAAFLSKAALVISGDTGPMHVAGAVGTPFLSLFGPTAPARFSPLSGKGRFLFHPVPCGPCYQKDCPNTGDTFMQCLRLISVSEAIDAARTLLQEPSHTIEDGALT